MSYGSIKRLTFTVASGASTSDGQALGGKPFTAIGVQVGTMSTATVVGIQNSLNEGTNYFNVFHQTINSATAATPAMQIATSVGAGGGFTMLPKGTVLQHLRFVLTAVVSGGVSFTVICSD